MQKKKNDKAKVAKLLTYGGQVIDPTAHTYIYMCIYIYAGEALGCPHFGRFES